jgi:hypothetical protein
LFAQAITQRLENENQRVQKSTASEARRVDIATVSAVPEKGDFDAVGALPPFEDVGALPPSEDVALGVSMVGQPSHLQSPSQVMLHAVGKVILYPPEIFQIPSVVEGLPILKLLPESRVICPLRLQDVGALHTLANESPQITLDPRGAANVVAAFAKDGTPNRPTRKQLKERTHRANIVTVIDIDSSGEE